MITLGCVAMVCLSVCYCVMRVAESWDDEKRRQHDRLEASETEEAQ